MLSKIWIFYCAFSKKPNQVFWLFPGLLFITFFSCRVGEKAPETKPYIFASLSEQCQSTDYRALFTEYFNQSLILTSDSSSSVQEKSFDEAVACTQKALKSVVSEIRGEETDSLSKEEIKALLESADFQKLLTDLGVKNPESKIKTLTSDKNFTLLPEIKTFIVEIIRHFLEGQPLEKACTSKRDRFHKWEMEVLISFLDKFQSWLKEVNTLAETVHTHLIETVPEEAILNPTASDPTELDSSTSATLRKDFFSDPQARTKYLFPALSEGFSERAPSLTLYLQEISYLLKSPPPSANIYEAGDGGKLSDAFFTLMETNPINGSPQVQRSDIQLLVIIWDIAHLLLQIYDANEDGVVSKQEFQDNISCLEEFLLHLKFKNKPEYLHYFIEYQTRPDETWGTTAHYFIWNEWTSDENFFLSQGDLFHLTFKIVYALPWHFLRTPAKKPSSEKLQQILNELQQATPPEEGTPLKPESKAEAPTAN